MKKASEYATMFKANPTEKTLGDIAQAFINEVKEIAMTRNARSNAAMLSILDKQDRKWKAFARHIEGIKPDGFEKLIKFALPEVYTYWRAKPIMAKRPRRRSHAGH